MPRKASRKPGKKKKGKKKAPEKKLFFPKHTKTGVVRHGKEIPLIEAEQADSPWRKMKFIKVEGRKVPKGGQQVTVTKAVQEFADQFKGKNLNMVKDVVKTLRNRHRFRPLALNEEEMKHFYARRTAHDIIATGVMARLSQGERKRTLKIVRGCVDYCLALIATLKAKGVKCWFTRLMNHSRVIVKLPEGEYIVDPLESNPEKRFQKRDKEEKFMENYFEESGLFAKGKDSWDLGMYSMEDYRKYWRFSEKQRKILKRIKGEK